MTPDQRQFDYAPGQPNLYLTMRFKHELVAKFGLQRGFEEFCRTFGLPEQSRLRPVTLESERDVAAQCARFFVETGKAGEPFVHQPPRVVGRGNHRPIRGSTRTQYVACLDQATVQGRSALIDMAGHLLLDVQDGEPNCLDDEIDWDPSVFHSAGLQSWRIEHAKSEPPVEVAEAFTMLGAHTDFFGHWMCEYLPKYTAARLSHFLPDVPVLIDSHMPRSHRESLQHLFGGSLPILEVPAFKSVRVDRLWCAPTLSYFPLHEVRNERFSWDLVSASAARLEPVVRDLQRRLAASAAPERPRARRVYLARKSFRHRRLTNSGVIEQIARELGFEILYPEDLLFQEQAAAVHHADVIVAPEGSAVFLCIFARRGSTLCILSHPLTDVLADYNGLLSPHGVNVIALTGPITEAHPRTPHDSDYEIDEQLFRRVVRRLTKRAFGAASGASSRH